MEQALKVGALTKRTGLTVRTLHHYDEIGLLSPTARTHAGHRLYGEAEVKRLQQIASLKQLGLPLDEINECLARPEYSLDRVLELQVDRIREQIERQERLRELIESLRAQVRSAKGVSIDDLTRTIEVTTTFEKYYTPPQMEQLRQHAGDVGQARIDAVQNEWMEVFAAYERAMNDGLDPSSDEVLELARRSTALVAEFTGGDAAISSSLSDMYETEGGERVMEGHGVQMAPGLWAYMQRAREALSGGS